MSSRHPRRHVGPPEGADHLYEVFRAPLDEQLLRGESLDRKLGVAIGALIAITGAVYAAHPQVVVVGVIASWLLVALVKAIRRFAYHDRFADRPDTAFLREREHLSPEVIRWHALVVLEESLALNEPKLVQKGRLLNQVTATIGLVAGTALIGRMLGLPA